ncbi:MAG: hypothetical protein ACRDSJ_02595 [Rubrobacteraceae bacterium]
MTEREVDGNRERSDSERLDRLERDRSRAEAERDRERSRGVRSKEARAESEQGTSWASVVIGLLTALGAGVILSGIGGSAASQSAAAAIIGLLITLFIAYTIGGYASGRMASRSGLKHGLLVPVLGVALLILAAIVASVAGVSLIDDLSGAALPSVPQQGDGLETILSISGILALLFTLLGSALGGAWGARTGRRRGFVAERR